MQASTTRVAANNAAAVDAQPSELQTCVVAVGATFLDSFRWACKSFCGHRGFQAAMQKFDAVAQAGVFQSDSSRISAITSPRHTE